MREDSGLLFGPGLKYSEVNWFDEDELMEAFRVRLKGWYLKPAFDLITIGMAFPAGVLEVCLIDALIRVENLMITSVDKDNSRRDYANWLRKNITCLQLPADQKIAVRFYEDIRCGLVHEGRAKRGAEFDLRLNKSVDYDKEFDMVSVNPKLLHDELETILRHYAPGAKGEISCNFITALNYLFLKELNISGSPHPDIGGAIVQRRV
ncbi:MAG: hypothetical protein A4E32_00510 [Methanomassiliicoccales archaeon PtaU1.Bin124]|nr:MAG: hypothetical protein A4E32_00510 [Methanomassiliicoccales archaeon PtaU1.Bin124]